MSHPFDIFGASGLLTGADAHDTPPVKLSRRTLGRAVEDALIYGYRRDDLEVVLAEELSLEWPHEVSPAESGSKRDLISGYMSGWGVPQMADLARRIVTELDLSELHLGDLRQLIRVHEAAGGVDGPTKNLIFAANGPKPHLVLRDAMNNDIEIVKNGEHCLIYNTPVPSEGLLFSTLVRWWRAQANLPSDLSDRDVAVNLHARLRASLDSEAETVVFDTYASRYRASFDVPALIPQVYLHYDPYDQRTRRASAEGAPLARQRMDFLLLYSDRRRVIIEVDGKQHYAKGDRASPELYGLMMAEDRKLRLAGYEVYRFGGAELFNASSKATVSTFFDELAARMG